MSETRRASRIPAYALVLFDVDKCHAVVPSKKIEGTVQENYKVRVKWNAGRKTELLDALIISLSDNKASLDQECVLRAESLVSELAQDVHCPPSSSSPNPEPSNPARKRKGSQNNGKQSKKTKSGTVKQKKREQQIVVEKACPPARQDDLEYVSEMHITPIQVDLGRRQEEVDRQVREYAVAAAAQENPDQNCETPPENATSLCCSNCRQIPILQQGAGATKARLPASF
ncbi:uncharacterized protein [Ptychodera flava]|uniref:uncharacterized protein n=1 Tax=Ptychodera flava TaxID=63121 RepID=UPI00396A3C16